ncbi:ribosome-binding ATPase YchF [bacterium BMS3Abin05]|nr:ribosome-binding ATPase YchF [bacterium BMS3Abin05]
MRVGIIGLPLSGKTTLFKALTGSEVEVGSWSGGKREAHIGIVKVPDERLDFLHTHFPSAKKIPAAIEYIDLAGFEKGISESAKVLTELLNDLKNVDALVVVIRAFDNSAVAHPDGSVNPMRDFQTLEAEFILSDMAILENRILRLERQLQRKKEEHNQKELTLLKRCLAALEEEKPLCSLVFSPEEEKILRGYQFLTEKPQIIVLNINESDIGNEEQMLQPFSEIKNHPMTEILALSAEIEMEIAQLGPEDAKVFQEDLGIQESALEKLIRSTYRLLGLISFFTIGDDEVRAWTIRRNTRAPGAAGTVHSDMERGFIRAEVVAYDAYKEHGSLAKCKEAGVFRLEGKEYTVKDGDIISFRFNI